MGITLKSALEYLKDFDTYSPYQEAITKVSDWIELFQANYDKRLREDMAAMLTELQLEIEEKHLDTVITDRDDWYNCGLGSAESTIQQKINALKENKE